MSPGPILPQLEEDFGPDDPDQPFNFDRFEELIIRETRNELMRRAREAPDE